MASWYFITASVKYNLKSDFGPILPLFLILQGLGPLDFLKEYIYI